MALVRGSTALVVSTGMLITAMTLISVITVQCRVAGRNPSTTFMATRRATDEVTQAPPVTMQAESVLSLDIEAEVTAAATAAAAMVVDTVKDSCNGDDRVSSMQ